MYSVLSILTTLTTAFMFLRMHHVHGADTMTERIIIIIGCIIFLVQAGFTFQMTNSERNRIKGGLLFVNFILLVLYAVLFFWFVDYDQKSIFSLFIGPAN